MAGLESKRLESPDEVRQFVDKGHVDLVSFETGAVGRGVFEPGWRWSEHVKPLAGTDSCQVHHVGIVLEGSMIVQMDGGEQLEVKPGDVFDMPPGHDAWVTSDEPCVLLDFGGLQGYAKGG